MAASIQSSLYYVSTGLPVPGTPTLTDTSRDDLMRGYQVRCASVYDANTYSWTLAFTPDSTSGETSTASLLPPYGSTSKTCRFNADWTGAYLLRLVVDAGLPTESTMFLRFRALTTFAGIKLVAAGERRDSTGVVPVDASPEGWANDQNQNLLKVLGMLRRTATSGRTLYVDANRGRDSTLTPNDPTNLVEFPGPDPLDREKTGFQAGAIGFGDFSSINDAITYAADAVGRGEPAPSLDDPYWIVVSPGFYEENVTFQPFIHVISSQRGFFLAADSGYVNVQAATVRIRTQASLTPGVETYHKYYGTSVDDLCYLQGVLLESYIPPSSDAPCVLALGGGTMLLDSIGVSHWAAGIALSTDPSSVIPFVLWGVSCGLSSQDLIGGYGTALSLWGNLTSALVSFSHSIFIGGGVNEGTVYLGSPVLAGVQNRFSSFRYCNVTGSSGGNAITGLTNCSFDYTTVSGPSIFSTDAGACTGNFTVSFGHCNVGPLTVDGTNTTGDVTLRLQAVTSGDPLVLTSAGLKVIPQLGGSAPKNVTEVTNATSPYPMMYANDVFLANTFTGVVTIDLEADPEAGRSFTIRDLGNAAGNNITINGNGKLIDGGASVVLTTNNEFRTYTYDGGAWYRIG